MSICFETFKIDIIFQICYTFTKFRLKLWRYNNVAMHIEISSSLYRNITWEVTKRCLIMKNTFFLGVFLTAAAYTLLLFFMASSFLTTVSWVVTNLAWVLFMLTNWNTFKRGKVWSILAFIVMNVFFVAFIYKLLA